MPRRAVRQSRGDDAVVQSILVAPGRIAAFVLEPDRAFDADPARHALAGDERGSAFAQRQLRSKRRQQRRPALQARAAAAGRIRLLGDFRVIEVDLQRILHVRRAGARAAAQQRRRRAERAGSGRPASAGRSPPIPSAAISAIPARRAGAIGRGAGFAWRLPVGDHGISGPDFFGENLHLVEQFGHAVGGEEQAEEMRHAGFAQRGGALDDGVDAADQIDIFRIERSLALERRLLQRFEMFEHLALAEAGHRLVLIAPDMDDILRRDLQDRKIFARRLPSSP